MRKRFVCLILTLTFFVSSASSVRAEQQLFTEESLDVQIESLMEDVAELCDIDVSFVDELYHLSTPALYVGKYPNVYVDETVSSAGVPMQLFGVDISYKEIPLERCESVSRIMKYYLPDAMYSVVSEISDLFKNRLSAPRGAEQVYFDSLLPEIQERVAFYEAILQYIGVGDDRVGKFLTAYEKLLTDKNNNENVVEVLDSGELVIKSKFSGIFDDVSLNGYSSLSILARLFARDKFLAESDSIESLRSVFILPYEPNLPSRENMLVAAACLVGKVRYVWGGGHSGASYIDGINPVWQEFNAMYPASEDEEGYNTCIKPSGSWCPIHGYSSSEYHGGSVYSLDDYVESRADSLDSSELLSDKYRAMLSQVDYSHGINAHTLDGLDCSGFASWLYNQATDKYQINSTARDFTEQAGVVPLEFGCDLLPGDLFAWLRHIVIIVGKVSENSDAYVTVESTPSVLRYGVVYYESASKHDIDLGMQIAREANELIGGISLEPHLYCMNTVGFYKVSAVEDSVDVLFPYAEVEGYDPYALIPTGYTRTEETETDEGIIVTYYTERELEDGEEPELRQYVEVGRLDVDFEDVEGFENLTATEILQRVLPHLPIAYVTGYSGYSGDLFDKLVVTAEEVTDEE